MSTSHEKDRPRGKGMKGGGAVKDMGKILAVFLAGAALNLASPPASAVFLPSESTMGILESGTDWDTGLLYEDAWDVPAEDSQDGVGAYSVSRAPYTEEYYGDLVTTTKEYLGITDYTGGGGDMAAVALREWEACEAGEAGTYEDNGDNVTKYTEWYYGTAGASAPWCCIFVSWCAGECGYLDDAVFPRGNGKGYSACANLFTAITTGSYGYEWYRVTDCRPFGGGYTPVPGDLLFFRESYDTAVYDHVGIVVEVTDTALVVVEGNSNDRVGKNEYTAGNLTGHAYYGSVVHVPYPEVTGEEGVFRYLTDSLGYPVPAACGILASIDQETGGTFEADTVEIGYGQGYGLCQWTDNGSLRRKTGLMNWCAANGYDYTTAIGQLEYLDYELRYDSYYHSELYGVVLYDFLMGAEDSADGAYWCGYYFARIYEGGGTYQSAEQYGLQRGALARDTYWPRYGA